MVSWHESGTARAAPDQVVGAAMGAVSVTMVRLPRVAVVRALEGG
jgi:hypothetical protein